MAKITKHDSLRDMYLKGKITDYTKAYTKNEWTNIQKAVYEAYFCLFYGLLVVFLYTIMAGSFLLEITSFFFFKILKSSVYILT